MKGSLIRILYKDLENIIIETPRFILDCFTMHLSQDSELNILILMMLNKYKLLGIGS